MPSTQMQSTPTNIAAFLLPLLRSPPPIPQTLRSKSLEELAPVSNARDSAPSGRELEQSKYEVVAGARRLRAANWRNSKNSVRVVKLTDAEAIEAQCVEICNARTSTH